MIVNSKINHISKTMLGVIRNLVLDFLKVLERQQKGEYITGLH